VESIEETIEINEQSHLILAQKRTIKMTIIIGFNQVIGEEIAIVARELASNLYKHAKGGKLILKPINNGSRKGIQITSIDNGPGIPNVNLALTDGYSTGGSLGFGLGIINRTMDDLIIKSIRTGTEIITKKYIRKKSSIHKCPLVIGAVSRPHPQFKTNGDAFIIKHWDKSVLVGVIDGLGHGQSAHRAAQAARNYVMAHYDQQLRDIFRGTDRACRATRGVVMALARFDWGQSKITLGSVGDILIRVINSPKKMSFIIRRGIIGVRAPNPVITERFWGNDNILVLHSDGISSKWRWKDFSHLKNEDPEMLAQRIIHVFGKDIDDATILVVKSS